MITRFCFGLVATVCAASVGFAAELTPNRMQDGAQPVPGARVSIEGGVRVIRPAPLDSGPNAMERADTTGSLLYRGAAFYRVPSEKPPNANTSDTDKAPAKSPAQ